MDGAAIPISRVAGQEFDPVALAAMEKKAVADLHLGQSYRQIVLQSQQVAVFEDQMSTRMATHGTYVYSPEMEMRGVIDLKRMRPVIVERETEDTAAVTTGGPKTRLDQHGRVVPANQGHGITIETTKRFIPAGYTQTVAGITIARPEKGFVIMHKNASNQISMTECISWANGEEDFVRRTKNEGPVLDISDLEIEFGDLNHYAKSTPMLELKSNDNLDVSCFDVA